jgi:hypothetical protein
LIKVAASKILDTLAAPPGREQPLRYLSGGDAALTQERPQVRALDEAQRARAVALFDEVAEGNAVVVHRELVREGAEASVRTVQRAVPGGGARSTPPRLRRCGTRPHRSHHPDGAMGGVPT